MQEVVIYATSFVLAVLPLLMAAFFLIFTKPRKLTEMHEDLRKLRTGDIIGSSTPRFGEKTSSPEQSPLSVGETDSPPGLPISGTGPGTADLDKLFAEYLSTFGLLAPAVILTILYSAGYLLCDSYLFYTYFGKGGQTFFSAEFLLASLPALYAFIGVYLFNLGAMVRRLYLADLNDSVFWGAINRLLLSIGLALAVMTEPIQQGFGRSIGFFAIGFIANIVLESLLYRVIKSLDFNPFKKFKRDDVPLQTVRGINVWKEYRLEEEGIESVQNLATANLIELAVRTHYNIRTLIDWIDQSIVLSRFTDEQVDIMGKNAVSISAVDLAACSPDFTQSDVASNALAALLGINPILMANCLNNLCADSYVRQLWFEWQSGRGKMPPQ
jgi:hypothetical protein